MFAIDVRTNCEAVEILPASKTVRLRDVASGEVTTESYDKLVLAPGAVSIRPPLPGIDLPGIFHVAHRAGRARDPRVDREGHAVPRRHGPLLGLPDDAGRRRARWSSAAASSASRRSRTWSTAASTSRWSRWPSRSSRRSIRRCARIAEGHLQRHGVTLALGDGVAGFEPGENGALEVRTKSGAVFPADLVILALGVRPDTALAKAAGLAIGAARRHPRRRPDAHQRSRHLRGRRRGRGAGLRHRRIGPGRAGRPGQPAGPHRRRRDRRARLALPRHAGHLDRRLLRRRRGLDGASARRRCSAWATPTTRRSTSTRTRTPATIRARSRSR